jgi:RNA polymerase sigma-70 factor (ECF subfamily)
MRKNWLVAARARRFRAEPLVPDDAFQGASEPYPGHWRQFPEPWPAAPAGSHEAALDAAPADLPELWRHVVTARYRAGGNDQQVAAEFDLTVDQVRDVLARARAAVRDRLGQARTEGAR